MTAASFGFAPKDYDPSSLPDIDEEYLDPKDLEAFAAALVAPESSPFISLNDWKPINQKIRHRGHNLGRRKRNKRAARNRDETREGFVYTLFKWPLLILVLGWIIILGFFYWLTRAYVASYESFVTWRGRRQGLRENVRSQRNYKDWKLAAEELDRYLHNDEWKQDNNYAYYDSGIVREALEQLRKAREAIEKVSTGTTRSSKDIVQLQSIVETCVKNNFVGVENPRLYSETYYGTKDLVQAFVDEIHSCLQLLLRPGLLEEVERDSLAQRLHANYGRSALCLSGGASFAWYHFGVLKALLDSNLLPNVVTGTSGGALVAALLATRTDAELESLLIPALAYRINACEEPFTVWFPRWWRAGARFDSLRWARQCSWFTRGSMTFREAYQRTGRILNVSCVPSDPHSPTLLTNVVTAPDCVIWSAVLASAAVPGILNPIPMMSKTPDGKLVPFSFGHKWKDGSLRTDIPLRSLNLHFGVTFSVVSQVNPHVNAFFYASKGTVGRPVTHRKGRGWRGGYLGSALETYLKLELQKFLKILRNLELLPRILGQDWSGIWLQSFSGTITIWPKSRLSDFWYILSDPTPSRLARMLLAGQQSTWPKLLFVANRMKIERCIEGGLREKNFDGANANAVFRRRNISDLRPHSRMMPNGNFTDTEEDSDVLSDGQASQIGLGRFEETKRQGNFLHVKPIVKPILEHDDSDRDDFAKAR